MRIRGSRPATWCAGSSAGDRLDPREQTPDSSCGHRLTVFFHRELGGDKDGNADATRYTASSGATVFASGSQQFAWGLDDFTADPDEGHGFADPRLQTVVRNAFDAMTGR